MRQKTPKEKRIFVKNCQLCCKTFETTENNQKFCSPECVKAYRKEYWRERSFKKKHMQNKDGNSEKHLVSTMTEAKEKGMSYGQLQAMRYLESIKEQEEERKRLEKERDVEK